MCINPDDATRQDIRPLRIGILNVMPKAESYEFSLLQPLGRSIIQIEPLWIRLETHPTRAATTNTFTACTSRSRRPFAAIRSTDWSSPVHRSRRSPYEEVRYWDELEPILSYARRNVASTLGICWGGLALAKLVGIEKVMLPKKLFGVFQKP